MKTLDFFPSRRRTFCPHRWTCPRRRPVQSRLATSPPRAHIAAAARGPDPARPGSNRATPGPRRPRGPPPPRAKRRRLPRPSGRRLAGAPRCRATRRRGSPTPPPQLLAGAVLVAAARSGRELAGPARRPAAGSGVPRRESARPLRLRPCSGECPSPASFSALPGPDLEFSG
nr:serine/arginine repetitive matrix protein 1-like [Aegilops tauschii subsp. strangulata]